ncbi:WD40-repeat-containing domain protein [Nemania abortiva]|nr:WD40-repeat-containing domain protein [Nemania abortiva]
MVPLVKTRSNSPSRIGTLVNDVALPSYNEDTIQSLSWSPAADHLAAASWDGKVRFYDVSTTRTTKCASALVAEGPVFSCDWAKDGSMVIAGGADKKLHVIDIATSQQVVVGSHDAPVRGVRFVEVPGTNGPIAVSGSWDKTVKFWDLRQPATDTTAAAITLNCSERVYSLDAKAELLVAATADLQVHLVDLKKPDMFLRTARSPLNYQTTAVSVSPDGKSWGIASTEGRCGIRSLNRADPPDINFTFTCHRKLEDTTSPGKTGPIGQVSKIWAVNDIQFHPVRAGIFTTAGSDGSFSFWHHGPWRHRIREYPRVLDSPHSPPSPPPFIGCRANQLSSTITATSFSRHGNFFAYAVSYDWCWDAAGNSSRISIQLMLHSVEEEDLNGNEAPDNRRRMLDF